ncbi:penicillin-binding protein 2 [Nitriliruptoraceae bacterium ZYF776]|nr:penicillin-binding protein 2 [Profundirhabdus halotolerans]
MTTSSRRQLTAARRTLERTDGAAVGVRRLRWLLGIYGMVALIVVGQLVRIQVVDAPGYADLSVAQRARTVELAADRGRIYDREGDVLATTVQAATVYADPRLFRPSETPDGRPVPAAGDVDEAAAALAPLLEVSEAEVADRLERDTHFVYLARQLDHEVGEAIRELALPGIGVIAEPRRTYPSAGLASQVVGFTGIDGEGLQGLEARYDDLLRGRPGMLALERAPGGLAIASGMRELVPSEAGTDLVLTLDREVQHAAEAAAAAAVEEYEAAGASIIVLEVGSGDVLAMASAPSFDPEHRGEVSAENWRNRAVTDVFEPGSTQKALTIAAAIEEGLIGESSAMQVADDIHVGGKTFTDSSPHPTETWTLTEIMERSSNVGTIQVAQQLGPERLDAYLRSFGYGGPIGNGFPGEASGLLMPTDQWWGTSLPTIAIGQGVAVTLLQLANSYATLANDGVAVDPRLVRGTVGEDGRLTPAATPNERRVVSADTARQVNRMLGTVVSGEHGTGQRAAVDGFQVAGKTGTARKPSQDARGYSGEYVATFVGFAPVEDPQLVVAVMVDEPTPIYGGVVAAPVFSEVMEIALTSRRIAPDGAPRSLGEALEAAADARAAADEAARQEGPADDADDPASPPAGDPVGTAAALDADADAGG